MSASNNIRIIQSKLYPKNLFLEKKLLLFFIFGVCKFVFNNNTV